MTSSTSAATTEDEAPKPNWSVLFYVPNLIGYVRLLLILGTLPVCFSHPKIFCIAYTVNVLLDGVDGIAARRLGQCSKFGMWLDWQADWWILTTIWVVCASLWPRNPWVIILGFMEFAVGGTYMVIVLVLPEVTGSHWKARTEDDPWWCKMIFANGYKNPIGGTMIIGEFGFPLILYAMHSFPEMDQEAFWFKALFVYLAIGYAFMPWDRFWFIWRYVKISLSREPVKKKK